MTNRKVPRVSLGTFFYAPFYAPLLALICTLLLALPAFADCTVGEADEWVTLDRVLDGDTLVLRDGRHLRLIGVNTPELAKRGRAAQPLAREARDFTRRFLSGGDLQLVYDRDRRDRYGRLLAHVYNHRGDSLEAALLAAGLAFHIAIAPNLTQAECLAQSERGARRRGLGIWAPGVWPVKRAADVQPGDGGFVLLRGTVRRVDRNRYLWLELDGPVALRVDPRGDFGQLRWRDWQGAQIEVKGWLVDRGEKYLSRFPQNKRWIIAIESPHTLSISRN
ncbi:Endonuclease YncB, thermonuclease family [Microbulbifer donghaiensis]|uniref:Endonuclease YncB, thermonuclease family n=1 Tax=Microbulbifer donghaiensis TaxID=494016 RepID=A0A1M5AAN3_9GAMM|nr:thermonuclease family protein [Microbulbifer donghaiensis]SHF27380.1 Endonuclease YncB, thermonuclease family [Microbulbifer donghaiensis]